MSATVEIGARIKLKRKQQHMTQAALAEKLGYTSRTSIAKIEAGEVDLPQSKVKQFAAALNVSPAYLMGWEDEHVLNFDVSEIVRHIDFREYASLSESEKSLVSGFRKLNPLGQARIMQLLDDLMENPRMTEKNQHISSHAG